MECRSFEINLISATDLEDVREIYRMKVYAEMTICDKQETKNKTRVDKENRTNPAWNSIFRYTVGELALNQDGVMIVIKLYCSRTLGDRYIGEVRVSIRELYSLATENGGSITLNRNVQRGGSVATQGQLQFACSFGEREHIVQDRDQSSGWRMVGRRGSRRVWRRGAEVLFEVTLNVMGVVIPLLLED